LSRSFHSLARWAYVLVVLLSGSYALLAYIPFTYQAVILFPMVSWIAGFVRIQPWLCLVVLAANAGADRERLARPATWSFYGVHAVLASALLWHPALVHIRNDRSSYLLALGCFLSPCWLLGLDLRRAWRGLDWVRNEADEARRLFWAGSTTAVFAATVFPLLVRLRLGPSQLPKGAAQLLWGWSFSAHFLVYLTAAAFLMGVLALGRMFRRPGVELGLLAGSLWLGLGWFLCAVVFPPVAFSGPYAVLLAGALAAMLVILGLATALAQPAAPRVTREGALDLLLRPLTRLLRNRPLGLVAWTVGLALVAAWALARFAVFDWNFLFQKTVVVAVGVLLFAAVFAALAPGTSRIFWVWTLILLPMVTANLFLAFDEVLVVRRSDVILGPVLDQRVGRDVAVRLVRDVLTQVRSVQQSIYPILQQNSNISRDIRTDPVDVQHVDRLVPTPGPKPDIYVFVVDSMRRDYLGAYNPRVHFTPELDRFAADALVMRNTFTRYGATGLSEPAIWTGSLMLHKQYITPFYPMNSLEKLVVTDGYQGLISMDSILDVVVKPGPWMDSLDPGVGTQDLRLGATLSKLQAALDQRGQDPRPLFVYSQSQDIHISVINREGRGTVMPGDYAGFYEPYASRLHRLDASFGRFIAFLKATHRYEHSLIIVAADHGDSLGEEGRFGHAYTLFPEIVRVPLLIHLPAAMKAGLHIDPNRLAFLTDITPTLYYLLGHRPVRPDRCLGRPLFTATEAEQAPYHQDRYLLASSYGAVFGILDGDGKNLYIADGVNFADHLYRMDGNDTLVKRELPASEKSRYDQAILQDIAMLNRFYHFRQSADKGTHWNEPREQD
jgi:hypothetical protein